MRLSTALYLTSKLREAVTAARDAELSGRLCELLAEVWRTTLTYGNVIALAGCDEAPAPPSRTLIPA